MHPALENLCGPGKPLKSEAPDANEIAGLLRTALHACVTRKTHRSRWKCQT